MFVPGSLAEKFALFNFRQNLRSFGTNSAISTWSMGAETCRWQGITCDLDGRVVKLCSPGCFACAWRFCSCLRTFVVLWLPKNVAGLTENAVDLPPGS